MQKARKDKRHTSWFKAQRGVVALTHIDLSIASMHYTSMKSILFAKNSSLYTFGENQVTSRFMQKPLGLSHDGDR